MNDRKTEDGRILDELNASNCIVVYIFSPISILLLVLEVVFTFLAGWVVHLSILSVKCAFIQVTSIAKPEEVN